MGTARQDFERFVQWLHEPNRNATDAALRFANLVLANFDAIAGTSRQRSNRSHLLARLARNSLAGIAPDLPPLREAVHQGEWPWIRLRRLTLGPFRGFREPQEFDLSRRVVLCYGPNGSGKSSLCEALEYVLCGSVAEAGQKRIIDREYLANIHARRFEAPSLTAADRDGREVEVRADENSFRFFFIEKNRIDNFSRIAAAPPARKGELIATLFGMDLFNEFASHFNESMDVALTLGTQTQIRLNARRQALATDEASVAGEAAKIAEIDQAATDYAGGFTEGLTYDGLKALVGSEETPGRLQELDAKLRAIPPALTGIARDHLTDLYANADGTADRTTAAAQVLHDRRQQVSFRDLFAAVQSLRNATPENCPACLTPIAETAQNPFERAEGGLQELAEIAALEADHQKLSRVQEEASKALRDELRKLEEYLESSGQQNCLVYGYVHALARDPEGRDWWKSVYTAANDESGGALLIDQILEAADRASTQDVQTREALTARDADLVEQRRLNDARVWIASHETKRTTVVQEAAQARTRIAQWQEANAELIRQADEEAEANRRDTPIKEAYDNFYSLLDQFREQLPGMLMADLNTTTMELYNEFNHGDRDEDKLSDLQLPLTDEAAIEIAFRGNPQRRVNALAALSEGHIRCLGLAILLAKAHSVPVPLIIFDDAINAIDHDHRSGIRAALFESDRFRQTQIIVTCHSPEFIKDIQNHLPRDLRDDCQQYVLQHHIGNYQPRVNPDVGSTNYLIRARQAMDRFDPRDALSFARKALEMFTHRSWKWLESHRVGDIAVQLDGPGKEPQLRGLCDALRSKLTRLPNFVHPSKQPLIDSLNTILGIPEQTLVWMLLNKGTHEEPDRDDFDLHHVATVLEVLEAIDALELRPRR